jgi:hypothetical protein
MVKKEKERIIDDVTLKKERKFSIRDLHTHVSMFFKKFREEKKTNKSKFYQKRGR